MGLEMGLLSTKWSKLVIYGIIAPKGKFWVHKNWNIDAELETFPM